MSKLAECNRNNSDLIKLKMVLQAMDFGECFDCVVLRATYEVYDGDDGIVTLILDTNKYLEEE